MIPKQNASYLRRTRLNLRENHSLLLKNGSFYNTNRQYFNKNGKNLYENDQFEILQVLALKSIIFMAFSNYLHKIPKKLFKKITNAS